MGSRIWVVVGGADRGGIIVREGLGLSSAQASERLGYGALLEELELQGDRLRYRKLVGAGPDEGWISTRLKNKDLAVRTWPDHLACGAALEEAGEHRPAMTFFAISDVHVEKPENMRWLEALPVFQRATVLVAGDLGVSLHQVDRALRLFKEKFDHVFYCYGNHETWAKVSIKADEQIAQYSDSFEKLDALRKLCDELGVITTPQLIEGVWVVPVLGWYHADWDQEPPLQAPAGKFLDRDPPPPERFATDTHACKWGSFENGTLELAKALDRQNDRWGVWPLPAELEQNLTAPRGSRRQPVISFSHFLPRNELMPEKRFLFQPNLAKLVGSEYIRRRVDALQPDLHVFGHSHFPWDMTLDDGVRYRSWPLGSPEEQARRIASIPEESIEKWHPLPVFDSDGRHYKSSQGCWFSLMYTRIPREPTSCHMASYVALTYCQGAPTVPETIITPPGCLPVRDAEQHERRERYSGKSHNSMRREVKNWSSAS